MAFFSSVDAVRLPALLHVGFGARIAAVAAGDLYLTADRSRLALVGREAAPLWYVVSRDLSPPGSGGGGGAAYLPRAAVALAADPSAEPYFLSLRGTAPCVTAEPCVVRVGLPAAKDGESLLSFRQVLQESMVLSVCGGGGVSLVRGGAGWSERFRLEVCASSIGRGMGSGGLGDGERFVSLAQATTLAVLELGVRFRLRSVHGRVLSLSKKPAGVVVGAVGATAAAEPAAAGAGGKSSKGKKSKPVIVRQDGPRSLLEETSETELVLEPMRRAVGSCSSELTYTFTGVNVDGVLSVAAANLETTRVMAHQTAAVLLRLSAEQASDEKCGSVLIVAPAGRGWGTIHVGARVPGDGATASDRDKRPLDWLMAGPRGRLETRHHCGAWESFRLEFVEQTYNASLRELPPSHVFAEADAAERAKARAEIAAKVSAARAKPSATVTAKSGKSGAKLSFNHAAALSGIGGDDTPASSAAIFSGSDPLAGKKVTDAVKGKNAAAVASKAAAGASIVTASNVPRNMAGKKARKQARKEKKKKSKQVQAQAAAQGTRSHSSSAGGSSAATKSVSDGSASSEVDSTERSASSAAKAASPPAQGQMGTGPPCSACGRACVGKYTKAMGKDFHQQCFGCRMCRRPLLPGTGQFREHGGVPYCNGCYAGSVAPKCARCIKPIMETVTTAMEKTWHKECLTCVLCRLPLTETFWLYADKPNEPRCSRCVTGSEERLSGVNYGSGRRAVNLPGPLFNHGKASGPTTLSMNPGSAAGGGRARITTPVRGPAARL